MNYNIKWNKNNYDEFIKYLYSLEDIKYKDFHSKLIKKDNLIGIKTPILKDIAKKIYKSGNYKEFLNIVNHNLYEENMIHAFIIGFITDYDEMLYYLDKFIKYIDNWAICDLMCSNLKIISKNLDKSFKLIKKLIKTNSEFKIRVGLVLLLNYYINDNYIDEIFNITNNINNEEYYIKMAIAWLLSICYIKYPIKTIDYLKNNNLSNWVQNQTIQKIKESNRVTSKDKKIIENYKRISK